MTPLSIDQPVASGELSPAQLFRAYGALLGSAIGDALGAPFEFGPRGKYSEEFPAPVLGGTGEMIGGGVFGWAPGEFTDDNQMAFLLALNLVNNGGLNKDSLWESYRAWSKKAPDVGNTTRAALSQPTWDGAAFAAHERTGGRSGSNGSVMRVAPVGVYGVVLGARDTVELAIAQSELTHFDPIAGVGAALVADVVRRLIIGAGLEPAVHATLHLLESEYPWYADQVAEYRAALDVGRDYSRGDWYLSNGGALVAAAQAVWAVRTTSSFHDAMVAAINLGGDTDTVAAIAGAIAGAMYGQQEMPVRWVTYVHGKLPFVDGSVRLLDHQDIVDIARALLGKSKSYVTPPEPPATAVKVHPTGVWAANLEGAAMVPGDFAVVSMCITEQRFKKHPARRNLALRDESGDANPNLGFLVAEGVAAIDAFLAEGKQVVVHCHGGRSRTGLLLKAWFMRHENAGHAAADQWLRNQWSLYQTYNESFMDFLTYEWELAQ